MILCRLEISESVFWIIFSHFENFLNNSLAIVIKGKWGSYYRCFLILMFVNKRLCSLAMVQNITRIVIFFELSESKYRPRHTQNHSQFLIDPESRSVTVIETAFLHYLLLWKLRCNVLIEWFSWAKHFRWA